MGSRSVDFAMRRDGAGLAPRDPALVTVAVAVRDGEFLLDESVVAGSVQGAAPVHGGRELAGALGSVPLYGLDLRLWIGWHDQPDRTLPESDLYELADLTGATVWVPSVGAS